MAGTTNLKNPGATTPNARLAGAPEHDGKARSQTLSRGLRLLELLAEHAEPLTVAQLAAVSGLHRSIVHRLLRTLEDHRLVRRQADAFVLGRGLLDLSAGVERDIVDIVGPHLQSLADVTDLAAFAVVVDGTEASVVELREPTNPSSMFTLRIGYRHPLDRGAPGLALGMLAAPSVNDDARLVEARARGWVWSSDEVMVGVRSVAAPVPGLNPSTALAVIYVGERDIEELGAAVSAAAQAVSSSVGR